MAVTKFKVTDASYDRPGFTVGKVYEADSDDGAGVLFTNDHGDLRYIYYIKEISSHGFEVVASREPGESVQKVDEGNSDRPQRIPFNLERALAGDTVVRRDGVKVSEVLRFKGGNISKPVISLSENGGFFLHTEDGKLFGDSVDQRDLFMAPKTKTVWVNLYNFPHPSELPGRLKCVVDKGIRAGEFQFPSRSFAENAAKASISSPYLVKTVSIEVPA